MNNYLIKLDKIESILLEWKDNSDMSYSYFSAIRIILSDIKENLKDDEDIKGIDNVEYIIHQLIWHLNSMIGCDEDNGKSFETHCIWALGKVSALTQENCLGQNSKTS